MKNNEFNFNLPTDSYAKATPKSSLIQTYNKNKDHFAKAIKDQRKDWPEYMTLRVVNVYRDNTFDLSTPDGAHLFERVGAIDPRAKDYYQAGKAVTVRFHNVNGGRPYIKFGYGFMGDVVDVSIVTPTGAITWSQMEGDPELHHGRWTTSDVVPKIFVPMWNYGGFAPTEMFASKPTHELPFMEAGTPIEIGPYSPVYGFVMFPNKAGQQCLAHAYLDYNPDTNTHYMVIQCYNLADPTKSWTVSGPFDRGYVFGEWDQTNNTKTEPLQKRMAYNKEDHQIVVLGSSYTHPSNPFSYLYLFDAEDGYPHFSNLDNYKILNNISFGKSSIMSAWWRSVKKVIPTVIIPNTMASNPMSWLNYPTGILDLSSIDEDFVEIWKKSSVKNTVEGVTYTDYIFTQKYLKSVMTEFMDDMVLDCSANNNIRWPYSRKADAYAYSVIRGTGLDLGNQEHRMTIANGVGYIPEVGYYKDVWTTPENPSVEISALNLNRYKYHAAVQLDIVIVNQDGTELYHDTITATGSNVFTDSGTFEYTSPAIAHTDQDPIVSDPFTVVSGYHTESVEPPPETYLSYDQLVVETSTIDPGTTYTGTYLGYVAEMSQDLVNTLTTISHNSGGTTGTIDETVLVEDWEDPSPIQYWAYGEGFYYRNEWAVIPAPSPRPQIYANSGREDPAYNMDPGTNIQYPVLSILQGLPCIFPLPVRNDRTGWAARLFAPTDTLQFGGEPLPSNASGVFDDDGNLYITYAIPEVWIRGCADLDKHFYVSTANYVGYDTASLGRLSSYQSITRYRVVSAMTAEVHEYPLPYPTDTYTITGVEVSQGKNAYLVQEIKYGMSPVSETVYRTYFRKVKFTPGAIDSHGVQAPGTYATEWDSNLSYYLQFVSPTDSNGDYVKKIDARGTPITLEGGGSYLPLKWFPLVSTPRPTLEQIWSITPIKAKVSPVNRLIMILDKRVDQSIMIESVPFLYIFDTDSGNIIGNVDIASYDGETIDTNDLGIGLYRKNYYYHEETTVSEAITARGGPEIIVNHDNLGNSIAVIKLWVEDRVTNEKSFKITTLYFNQDGFTASQVDVVEGTTGANGWNPYETLKALGSFKNCAFGDVIYFYDMVTRSFKKTSAGLETWENTIIDTPAPVTP